MTKELKERLLHEALCAEEVMRDSMKKDRHALNANPLQTVHS